MSAGDAACGVNALMPLYRRYADQRVAPDLARLFDRLGVRVSQSGQLSIDPRAELSELTVAITQRRSATAS